MSLYKTLKNRFNDADAFAVIDDFNSGGIDEGMLYATISFDRAVTKWSEATFEYEDPAIAVMYRDRQGRMFIDEVIDADTLNRIG